MLFMLYFPLLSKVRYCISTLQSNSEPYIYHKMFLGNLKSHNTRVALRKSKHESLGTSNSVHQRLD